MFCAWGNSLHASTQLCLEKSMSCDHNLLRDHWMFALCLQLVTAHFNFFLASQGPTLPHNPLQVVEAWNHEGHILIQLNCVHSAYLTNVFDHQGVHRKRYELYTAVASEAKKDSIHFNIEAMNYCSYHP